MTGDPDVEARWGLAGASAAHRFAQESSAADATAHHDDGLAADADAQAAEGDENASARDVAAVGRDGAHARSTVDSERAYEAGHHDHADFSRARAASDAAALLRTSDAYQRDEAARLGDLRSLASDRYSDALDRAAEHREASADAGTAPDAAAGARREAATRLRVSAAGDRTRAAADRLRAADDRSVAANDRAVAADDRAMAAEDRARAGADRARAAEDRLRAADDRVRAQEDRRQAILDVRRAFVDDLTGVSTRAFGLMEVQNEVHRAHRTGEPLVLGFVDVNRLKEVNDRSGHAAGDAVLRAVGSELKANLRTYDPIVRVGGDEFVCTLSNTTLRAAAVHLAEIEAALDASAVDCTISWGLVEMQPGEPLDELMARGDAELYRAKDGRRDG